MHFHPWTAELAGFAPVVDLGGSQAPASLSALIAAGAADFIADAQSHLPAAAACVEKRLQTVRRLSAHLSQLESSVPGEATAIFRRNPAA